MIKPIHFVLFIITIILFVVAISFTTKVDLENVNIHRDVSTLNQRLLSISNIEEKLTAFKTTLKQEIDKALNDGRKDISTMIKDFQTATEQDRAKVNSVDQRVKNLESQISRLQQENRQLKAELETLQNSSVKP